MLPHNKMLKQIMVICCILFTLNLFNPLTVRGTEIQPAATQVQEFFTANFQTSQIGHRFSHEILDLQNTAPFTLVGITWTGSIDLSNEFQVKVFESGSWSGWYNLNFDSEHSPEESEMRKFGTVTGTDPLATAPSTGVKVRVLNKNLAPIKSLKVSLIYSPVTTQDRTNIKSEASKNSERRNLDSVTTKSGAVVARPTIVSRAQWGADESLRDPSPRIGEKITAGFLHHTATTNSYLPEDGPAQMRNLYTYFINVRKYSDIAYNFIVDKYGVIYEGRAGCSLNSPPACDGPSRPVIGGHTAGMNHNTFAVSVLGNFQTTKPDAVTAEKVVSSVSALMAWKLAPYNLLPSAITKIKSTDTQGLSKFPDGAVASIPVITGHRDVGKTVCPGKFLYPYLPEIRARITGLLTGKIQDLVVGPTFQNVTERDPIIMKAKLPPTASWNVSVISAQTGESVLTESGKQNQSSKFVFRWEYVNADNQALPIGNYAISLSATIGQQQLPTETTMVTLGGPPAKMMGLRLKRVDKHSALITWPVQTASLPITSNISFRTSVNQGQKWSNWIDISSASTEQLITTQTRKTKVLIEFRQENSFGHSPPVQLAFISKS